MTGIRRGQLVSPFGVGAVVDIGKESYCCADLSAWNDDETFPLDESALQRRLFKQIRSPNESVPFSRFPRWVFCPSCRRMSKIRADWEEAQRTSEHGGPPRCAHCRTELAPMGFVQACEEGHLDDIDWYAWAHRNHQPAVAGPCSRSGAELRFTTSGAAGGDWSSLLVSCDKCKSSQNFDGLTSQPLPWRCNGRQPWRESNQNCAQPPYGFRRGNSNVYYPGVYSAIDIANVVDQPAGVHAIEDAVRAKVEAGTWAPPAVIRTIYDTQGLDGVLSLFRQSIVDCALELRVNDAAVREALAKHLAPSTARANESEDSAAGDVQREILASEWSVLARATRLESESLIVVPQTLGAEWPQYLTAIVRRISLIPRLREVRALVGFQRVKNTATVVPVDATGTKNWLPGVEVWGEGIFIEFQEERVQAWEAAAGAAATSRIAALQQRMSSFGANVPEVSARFIALHTLAHIIMRRLAFDAGYAASSIRERIYARDSGQRMAGLLIYTADGDSEGSLGGLVRMGEPTRLMRTIVAGLQDAAWCSADPVCGEMTEQGLQGLNGAACHACSLASETSCTQGNRLLDRRLLLDLGYAPFRNGLIDCRTLSQRTPE